MFVIAVAKLDYLVFLDPFVPSIVEFLSLVAVVLLSICYTSLEKVSPFKIDLVNCFSGI